MPHHETLSAQISVFLARFIAAGNTSEIAPELMEQIPLSTLMEAMVQARLTRRDPMVAHLYRQWIFANIDTAPEAFIACFNLGTGLVETGEILLAIAAFQTALSLKPDLYEAALHLTILYKKTEQFDEALEVWKRVLETTEHRHLALNQCAALLDSRKRYAEAIPHYRESLEENPQQPDIIMRLNLAYQKACQWDEIAGLEASAAEATPLLPPFAGLALFDDVTLQGRIAAQTLDRRYPLAQERLCPPEGHAHDRIRVGYLSGEFVGHYAMSLLTAELFERHDRRRFEIFGYCSSDTSDASDTRQRILAAFDHFHEIREVKDEDAARLIRSHEIDILVDLSGLTGAERQGILRWKPAPVQITYLGYIGPNPLPELDYILCDDYVIPPETAHLYQPKPLSLGGVYQPNDSKLVIAPPSSRDKNGLPLDGFVYCCFTAAYKITEMMFTAWMEILKRVPGSVLWLSFDNETAKRNLQAAAVAQGVDPTRLIFALKVSPADYLARLQLADLSLAAFPYGPGTLASDALRMGVPLLTLEGKSFVARMAGGLLTTVGLAELIAPDVSRYIDMAVELAHNRSKLEGYRALLQKGAWERTLGDMAQFTLRLENTYSSVVKRKPVVS